jgi:hypothetical protein
LVHENGSSYKEAGCKKFYVEFEKFPPEEWQSRSAGRLIGNYWRAFVKLDKTQEEFSNYLYGHYCPRDKEAAKDVLKLKRQFDKEEKSK